ncbi:uncharacterized protein BJ171DRAFT_472589 [Polychytrium aggregatum]|uniref:uncharacterized protein n=1 Tax=Polychytrium aggregatum TaxID=110093 RepID=UPI0022FEFE03|nr:uncharacterized protein BJ171DRAFT_472589 [Polychytrium aggregatum]KAI9207161.1 hypothetical protein BJ171DRAFT_472589 [Polychytrium aggregatum]
MAPQTPSPLSSSPSTSASASASTSASGESTPASPGAGAAAGAGLFATPVHDFVSAIEEFDSSSLFDGYRKIYSAKGFDVYKRPWPRNPNLFEYKVHGVLKNVPMKVLARVYIEYEYRRTWDERTAAAIRIKDLEEDPPSKQSPPVAPSLDQSDPCSTSQFKPGIFRNVVPYPFPLSHREYVYALKHKHILTPKSEYAIVIGHAYRPDEEPSAQPTSHPVAGEANLLPVQPGYVRVDTYHQLVAMRATPDGKSTEVIVKYVDDPKASGGLFGFVANWVAKVRLPGFFFGLEKACDRFVSTHPQLLATGPGKQ